MQGLLSPMPQPERRASIFDRFEGRGGLLGALGDPERRARLAYGMMSLSKAPPMGMMELVRDDMTAARDADERLRVAEWLAQQPGGQDYAGIIAAGGDPAQVVAAFVAANQPQPGTDDMREYEFARSQGFEGSFADWQAMGGGQGASAPASVQEYQFYTEQERAAGREPMPFSQWQQGGTSGAADLSLTPVWGTGPDGQPVLIQVGEDGNAVQTRLPEGVNLRRGTVEIDTGTEIILQDQVTGEVISRTPKNVAGAAAEQAIGTAEGAATGEARATLGSAEAAAQQALDLIQSVASDPALPSVLGSIQGRLPSGIPGITGGQAGADVQTKIDQLQGQAFLRAFESLKGGGAITQMEGEAATRAIARLQQTQSPEAFRQALAELEAITLRGLENARRRAGVEPAAPAASAAPAAGASAPPQSFLMDPEASAQAEALGISMDVLWTRIPEGLRSAWAN